MSLSQSQIPDGQGGYGTEPRQTTPYMRGTVRRRSLRRLFDSSLFTTIVVVIGLLWSVPTFGLFVSSFRPGNLIKTTGWWTGLVPPWNFTLENYQQVLSA